MIRLGRAPLALAILAAPLLAAAATQPFDFSSAPQAEEAAPAPSAPSADSFLGGIIEQVSAEMLPSIPKPGDAVSIRVTSYSTNLSKANIVWRRDGQTVAEGVGLRRFSFEAPEAGTQTVIEMVAQKEEGGTVRKSFTVAPADLDLIYEVDTYAPVMYEGRTEFTNSSNVRLVALPNFVDPTTGRQIPPEELVYTWRIDDVLDQDASGQGRDVAVATGKLVSRGMQVELLVEAIRSPLKARVITEIEDQRPQTVLYEDHPLYGVVFERAIAAEPYPVKESEISLVAIPYSMDIETLSDPRASFTWTTPGGRGEGSTVVFANQSNGSGIFPVQARVNHRNFAQYTDAAGLLEIFQVATGSAARSAF